MRTELSTVQINRRQAAIQDNIGFQTQVLVTSASIASIALIGCIYSSINSSEKLSPIIGPTAVVGLYSACVAGVVLRQVSRSQNVLKQFSGKP